MKVSLEDEELFDRSDVLVEIWSLCRILSILHRIVPFLLDVKDQINPAASKISIGSIGARKRGMP